MSDPAAAGVLPALYDALATPASERRRHTRRRASAAAENVRRGYRDGRAHTGSSIAFTVYGGRPGGSSFWLLTT